jgi:hypothetical protein
MLRRRARLLLRRPEPKVLEPQRGSVRRKPVRIPATTTDCSMCSEQRRQKANRIAVPSPDAPLRIVSATDGAPILPILGRPGGDVRRLRASSIPLAPHHQSDQSESGRNPRSDRAADHSA